MSDASDPGAGTLEEAEIPLDRDIFLRSLIRELAGTLEDVVGLGDARGFISVVGGTIGEAIDRDYRRALGVDRLSRAQATEALVDLKRRIGGDFYVIDADRDKIVLGNRACPFGDKVAGRSSMCMMTSNVFGRIVADNLGYARVELQEAIARGHPGCRVVIHLTPSDAASPGEGREYFQSLDVTPKGED